jgi:hypothetical protein
LSSSSFRSLSSSGLFISDSLSLASDTRVLPPSDDVPMT